METPSERTSRHRKNFHRVKQAVRHQRDDAGVEYRDVLLSVTVLRQRQHDTDSLRQTSEPMYNAVDNMGVNPKREPPDFVHR